MRAEASTTRAEMFIENSRWGNEKNILAIYSKFNTGDILTEIEENNMRHSMRSQLRYFENLHYQWQLGVLDEEIWQTNLSGISAISRVPSFKFFYPDWPNGFEASTLRSSFVELISSLGE